MARTMRQLLRLQMCSGKVRRPPMRVNIISAVLSLYSKLLQTCRGWQFTQAKGEENDGRSALFESAAMIFLLKIIRL